jgi:hypothetical protein
MCTSTVHFATFGSRGGAHGNAASFCHHERVALLLLGPGSRTLRSVGKKGSTAAVTTVVAPRQRFSVTARTRLHPSLSWVVIFVGE